jgi:gliding motility-associated-like protein
LKKYLLISFCLVQLVFSQAANRYWVGGSGAWNNTIHWSENTGGVAGAAIPTASDDVFFDQNSFSADKQTVMITSDAYCHNMDWSGISYKAILSGTKTKKNFISGSFKLSSLMIYGFKGQTEFTSSSDGNTISTLNKIVYSNWIFNGTGSWMLNDDLTTSPDVTISLLKGNLNTNSKHIICGSFTGNSSQERSLKLGNSEILVNKTWDFSNPANLLFDAGNSSILFNDTIDNTNFHSGGLRYSNVTFSVLSQNTTTCVFPQFTVTLTADSVTCNGLCDGAAHVVVTGGSGAPVFDWNFAATPAGDGTANITGLCASTNTVKVTEIIAGVTVIHFCSISVGEPPPLNDFLASSTMPTCFGLCNGFIDVDETGGTPPYTYSSPLGSNDTAINVCAGTYTFTVTDSRGCKDSSAVITLTAPALLVAPGSSTNVSCFGFCDGTASVVASGGTAPYSYNWTPGNPPGDGTATITGLCPGPYTCTVTDFNGCTATFNVTITQPPVLTLVMSHTNTSCFGICNGTATATVSGGTPPYIYSWSNGSVTSTASTTNTVSSLCAGIITVTITDANGCTISNSVTITQPAVLVATATGVNVTCFGLCNGSATTAVAGGTPIYTYSWVGPAGFTATTASISSLCPGVYTVTVTDSKGCTSVSSVTITEPLPLLANPVGTNITCFGLCNGSATATPSGGTPAYTFLWNTGATTATISSLCPGVYTVTVTDSKGCTSIQSVTITQPTVINTGLTFTNVTCNGSCNGTATSTPSGGTPGYTFLWSPGGATTSTISGLCPGVYTVTVTDANGCTKTGSVTITQPNILTVTISATVLSCNGDCNATATATIAGGTPPYTIDWLPGSPVGDGTTTISSLCAGTYTVNITDSKGCTATATITILQPTALSLAGFTTNVTCFGVCNGTAAVVPGGGTPLYSYLWTPGGQTTSSISSQCAGSYTLTLTDSKGCIKKDTLVINQPLQLFSNPSVANNVSCSGVCDGSATSAATGGTLPYAYNWTPGNPPGDGTPTITALCAGGYNLTVTDANSCNSTMAVTITQPAVLSAPITGATSSCSACNGTATVTPAGGTPPYSYLWNDGAAQTTSTAVGLCPNITYIVTVTDFNGCSATGTVTILQTVTITITTSGNTLNCNGACNGIATANPSGGSMPYVYVWTGPPVGGIVALTQTASGLCAGTYTVNVSDAAGCFNTDSITFVNPPLLTAIITHADITCAGACTGTATATPSGGTGAYTYSWAPSGQTTQTATALCVGTHTVTVTDASGCTHTDSAIVTSPTAVVDNVTITSANCLFADGSISVAPTGGAGAGSYTYNWNGAASPTGDGTPTITNLLPGVYTLDITSGGCVFSFNYLLSNTTGPTLVMSHTDVSCNNVCDGTATVVASGGAGGYIYDWTPGAPLGDGTAAITSLCGTTTYVVTVTDAAGCISLGSATVVNPLLISPNPTIVNETCGGTCNGSISLAPTGGTGPYTYLWSTGAVTSSISGLCAAGSPYTVTVKDANLCDSILVINITSPPTLTVTLASTNVLCNGACNGTATATPVGGTPPYTYSWSHGGAFVLANVVGLCPGPYTVTVIDFNLCTASATVIITEPLAITTLSSQTNATCNGVCDGTATVTPAGGTGAYAYSWAPAPALGQTTATAVSLCAGSYNVTVTDANGCISSPPAYVITQPPPIVPNAMGTNATCNGSCNGSGTANPTGGSGVYTYSWNCVPVQNTQTATNLCAGTYIVTVNDGSCSATQSVTLTDPAVLSANPTSTSPTCNNSCNGTAMANPVGGTPAYSYSWSPGGAVTQSLSALCPGVYTVTVTDSKGCTNIQPITVVNPAPINIAIGSTPAACGACDGTISIVPTTGTPPYSYVWTMSVTGLPPAGSFAGNGTPNVTNVCAGLYDVLVTDANDCDSVFTIPMNNSSGPTGETVVQTNATCPGSCDGTATVTPIGGIAPYTFLWNDGPPATVGASAINLCAGNYFVQVTDASGCIHFSPVTILQPAPILSNAVTTMALCSNICTGAITVAPSGGTAGYTYMWTPGAIVGQGTPSVSVLCSGTYTLTITDANLCPKIDSFVVGQSTPLTVVIASTNISCAGVCNGTAYITISAGTPPYVIQWNDPSGQTNDTATALCAGNYSVDVTDANGCTITLNTTITAAPALVPNPAITNASCGLCDGTATLAPSGGTAGYTYLWSNGQNIATATNLCSGLYTVNITDGAGCVTSVPIPVSNTGGPTSATITSTNISCGGVCNGSVTAITPVGGTAPYTYLWIASGLTTPAVGGLCAGTYFVQITDANGCSLMDSVIITQPAPILANQVITAATCGVCDGTITIAPSGGVAPYTVLWNTGSSSLALINLCAGVYSVDITDNTGCVQNVIIPLNSAGGLTLTTSSTNVTCNGSCNGTTTVIATGGVPAAYLWNDVALQTTSTATALCPGTYFVTVPDAAGCISIASATVTQPPVIGFSVANAQNPLCNGNANGSITTIPSGGTLSYTYTWTPAPAFPQTTATASGLNANTYIVTMTDANGCTATQTVTLINPVSLTISDVPTPASCNTISDGAIDVTVGGGTLPYAYQWSGGSAATTQDLVAILSGSYTITVTDSNFCSIADTIILAANSTVIAVAGNDTAFCQAGALTLNASGSTNGVNYQWFQMPANTSVGNTAIVSVNPPSGVTSYYVVVDNGTGCSDNDTILVTSNPSPSVNAGPDVTIIIGGTTPIGGSPTTGMAGATIAWTPSPGGLDNSTATNPNATPSTTTTYTVTVTSPLGCSASDSAVVTVRPTIVFPDGISPNGDGANDEWIIDGIELFPNCTVEVYNRWGELLFQSLGYKEHWKGLYKNKPLPVGTYYYIIDLKDPLFPDAYTGPITIMR